MYRSVTVAIIRAFGTRRAVLVFFIRVTENAGIEILVSFPKTLEWKQIQFSDTKSFPWYNISFWRAQVKLCLSGSSVGTSRNNLWKCIFALYYGENTIQALLLAFLGETS